MLRAATGDGSAFERLYLKYLSFVGFYLISLDHRGGSVADMVQEVFTRLWANRTRFTGESTFKTYLLGYANRVWLEEQRHHMRNRNRAAEFLREGYRPGSESQGPDMAAECQETKELLARAIMRLTVEQRQALRLWYAEQMSLETAARAIGCTKRCFEGRLGRARRKLRDLMLPVGA